ncbi:MAG: AAA family ATPase [Puniceicoccales bacterium]|nr:AAA family ATPase [Puniceicoccales bacterium]
MDEIKIFRRLLPPSLNSFFLFGPRGTGKTLWLKQTFPDALKIDLLQPENARLYSANPERLRDLTLGRLVTQPSPVVVIDEIQRVPQLLDVIHSLHESHPQVQFIMTGSSARKIRRQDVNLLGGRASWRTMHPFLAAEMGPQFQLSQALQYGMLPVIWGQRHPADALKSYVGTYLEEKVKHEGFFRHVEPFARFLSIASFSHGSIPNATYIARECGVSQPTAQTYFEILKDLLISFHVPLFSKRAKRVLISANRMKFYYADTGIYRTLRPKGTFDRPEEIEGLCLEGLVAQHLRAWCDYFGDGTKLYYWRTKAGVEVDFVLDSPNGLWAIEVKHSDVVRREHLSGLRAFGKDYPEAQQLFIYRGHETLVVDSILCLPCEDFLRQLKGPTFLKIEPSFTYP